MVAGQESAWDTQGMGEMMVTPPRASVCTGTPLKRECLPAAIDAVLLKPPVDSTSSCMLQPSAPLRTMLHPSSTLSAALITKVL